MHQTELHRFQHSHVYGPTEVSSAEKRTRWVVALTLVMMTVELAAGTVYESMALLADGWHMASHAAALLIAAFAYAFARRHAGDERYTFGTGKVPALSGFGSAVGLGIVAILVLVESVERLVAPVSVRFEEATIVAGIGLVVNLFSAWMLRDPEHHYGHGHSNHEDHHDHNLRGAYLHVLADALTSVLAIAALLAGRYFGWSWMDAAVGVLGAVVIGRWSLELLRETSGVLLDAEVSQERREGIVRTLESESDNRVSDLHLWRVGPKHMGAIISIVTHEPRDPEHYKRLLSHLEDLVHVTVEVQRCADENIRSTSSSRAAVQLSAAHSSH